MKRRLKSRGLAAVLAFALFVSLLPNGVFTTIFAAPVGNYTIILTDDQQQTLTQLDDVEVTLTRADDPEQTQSVRTTAGTAVFADFVETDASYVVKIGDVVGYGHSDETVTLSGETAPIEMERIQTVQVSGTIFDDGGQPYEGATVQVQGYSNAVEAVSGENGEYTFETNPGKSIQVTILPKEDDKQYASIDAGNKNYSSDQSGEDYHLALRRLKVTADYDHQMGSVRMDATEVTYGADTKVFIESKEGYCIQTLTVNSTEVADAADAESYELELTDIREDQKIQVVFYKATYTVEFNVAENGDVTYGSGQQVPGGSVEEVTVDGGSSLRFTARANQQKGYHVESIVVGDDVVLADGTNADAEVAYEIAPADIHSTVKVTVVFALNEYDVQVEPLEHGAVRLRDESGAETDTGVIRIKHGSPVYLVIVPENGYDLSTIRVNDAAVDAQKISETAEGYRTEITNITSDQMIVADLAEREAMPENSYAMELPDTAVELEDVIYVPEDALIKFSALAPYKRIRINSGSSSELVGSEVDVRMNAQTDHIDSVAVSTQDVGNWSQEADLNIRLDAQGPQISSVENDGVWFNKQQTPTYSFTVADEYSGVKEVRFSDQEDLASAQVLQPQVNGEYQLELDEVTAFSGHYYVWAIDRCGNVSKKTIQVNIDVTDPQIDRYEFSTKEDVLEEGEINFADKIFYNDTIYVTVQASDLDIASGIDTITLYCDDEVLETKQAVNDSAVFALKDDVFRQGKKISASAQDVAGNQSEPIGPSATDERYSDIIQINDEKPDISIVPPAAAYVDADGNPWYSDHLNFQVTASDENNCIDYITITLNGRPLDADSDQKMLGQLSGNHQVETFRINTDLAEVKNGANTLEVTVKNNTQSEETMTYTVYIDRTRPSVDHFVIRPLNDDIFSKAINFLSFGTFFNEQVEVVVTASDEGEENAGIKAIQLFVSGEAYGDPKEVDENNQASFVLSEEILEKNEIYTKDITAIAIDRVDHGTADPVSPTTVNADIKNGKLMLETVMPDVEIHSDEAVDDGNEATADGNDWYADDIAFDVIVTDVDSGLQRVRVLINDEELVNEVVNKEGEEDVETHEQAYAVSTEGVAINEDGSYKLQVEATDNAGNVYLTDAKTVYKDVSGPEIVKFTFSPTDHIEGALDQLDVKQTEYGFYFGTDTLVSIQAEDAGPSAGIRSITYYMVDYTDDADGVKTQEYTQIVDEENTIQFTIPANFKGQIYAKATDNVGNTQTDFVTPDGVIIEFDDKHQEETHIELEKEASEFTTNDGNELYSADVPVEVTIRDTYSGIRSVEWEITAPYDTQHNQQGSVEIDNAGSLDDDSWEVLSKDQNLVTEIQKTLLVQNDSNHIVLHVTMTDRAGNRSSETMEFSIDKSDPQIEISYGEETHDPENTSYFSTARTAVITIKERNFRASDVDYHIASTDQKLPSIDLTDEDVWTTTVHPDDPNQNVHTAKIHFTADGDYTFDLSYHDNAQRVGNTISQQFTIDRTKPVFGIAYDNLSASNGNYYNAPRTATLTIKEHNFDASRVNVVASANDDGTTVRFPAISTWRQSGKDTYTASIRYTEDAHYRFDIEFRDKAGNRINDYAVDDFYIDQTAPDLEISGVGDLSANNDVVKPVITYSDTNFDRDQVQIELRGANNGIVNYAGAYSDITNGQTYAYDDFERLQEVDDIYTLSVSLRDMAGNETEMSIQFSVNRFGSVYDLSQLNDIVNRYLQNEQDLIFREINTDELSLGDLSIVMVKNGTPVTLREGTDYTIASSGGNGEWHVYTYTIDRSLFAEDGQYSIRIRSTDAAGNVNENVDESKKAEITFGIDKTDPIITSVDLESHSQYAEAGRNFTFDIKDNLVLETVRIYLNGEEIEYEKKGDSYTFFVPESNYLQNVRIVAVDAAGNEMEWNVENFIVSTNFFVRWYNNTPLFIGTITAAAALIGVFVFLIIKKRKKNDETESE